jgi:predicted AAA+ superfamily ATPase
MLPEIVNPEVSGTAWQNRLCRLLASADNVFTRMAERGDSDERIWALAAEELSIIAGICNPDFEQLAKTAANRSGINTGAEALAGVQVSPKVPCRRQIVLDVLLRFAKSEITGQARNDAEAMDPATTRRMTDDTLQLRHSVRSEAESQNPLSIVGELTSYYRAYGAGVFESFDAFSLTRDGFVGISSAKPVKMADLIGYEHQKSQLIENTQRLVDGLPANNVLLYGDSGTGKSTSIKALLSEFAGSGLKLIAVSNDDIALLPTALSQISGHGLKFVVFIDDLSFDENEPTYKSFKSVIEGSLATNAVNFAIYVTSNRRNIVKETWKDRDTADDVHLRDNLQEKRSLSDRFGLTLIYESPDKQDYINIVIGIAKAEGIEADERLISDALKWEIRHGGRSGRTARQFIDHIIGAR